MKNLLKRKNLTRTLTIAFALIFLLDFFSNNEVNVWILYLLLIISSILIYTYKLSLKIISLISITLIVLTAFFQVLNIRMLAERTGIWAYYFMVISILRHILQIYRSNKRIGNLK